MTPTAQGPRLAPPNAPFRRIARKLLTGIVVVASIPLALGAIGAVLAGDLEGIPFLLIFLLLPLNLGVVGAVLATRRPDNAIGWLLLVAGVLTSVTFAAGEYQRYVFAR